jgi:hypothetical protein
VAPRPAASRMAAPRISAGSMIGCTGPAGTIDTAPLRNRIRSARRSTWPISGAHGSCSRCDTPQRTASPGAIPARRSSTGFSDSSDRRGGDSTSVAWTTSSSIVPMQPSFPPRTPRGRGLLVAVLGEVPNRNACWNDHLHRVLRPGGLLSITEMRMSDPDAIRGQELVTSVNAPAAALGTDAGRTSLSGFAGSERARRWGGRPCLDLASPPA